MRKNLEAMLTYTRAYAHTYTYQHKCAYEEAYADTYPHGHAKAFQYLGSLHKVGGLR